MSCAESRYTSEDASAWIERIVPGYAAFFPEVRRAITEGAAPPLHELRMMLRHVPAPQGSASALDSARGSGPAIGMTKALDGSDLSANPDAAFERQGMANEELEKLGVRPGAVMGSLQLRPAGDRGSSQSEMLARPPGDQVWEMGCDVYSSIQGRGLGTGMITAGMQAWIAWLGVGKVIAVGSHDGQANFCAWMLMPECAVGEYGRLCGRS